jgi:hypothetical protein
MFLPDSGLFCYRSRRDGTRLVYEGVSPRYTALVLIGASRINEAAATSLFAGRSPAEVCAGLIESLATTQNLGDAATAAWAAAVSDHPSADAAMEIVERLWLASTDHPTVEIAWMVTALSTGSMPDRRWRALAAPAVARLCEAYHSASNLFGHRPGWQPGPLHRGHVGCFADEIYPILALARYYRRYGSPESLEIAAATAERICRLQGDAGQWWWHYDVRTGSVIEGYPVYAVHQDAMAPMGLFELTEAGGPDYASAIALGLRWLDGPVEADVTLVDDVAPAIWRKIARAEPGKFVRGARAVLSRVHPALRWSWMNGVFRPTAVDYECRPYHLGWLIDAFGGRAAPGKPGG